MSDREKIMDALKSAEMFIVNGTELGYIHMPDPPDPALQTLPKIRAAIALLRANDTRIAALEGALRKARQAIIDGRKGVYLASDICDAALASGKERGDV